MVDNTKCKHCNTELTAYLIAHNMKFCSLACEFQNVLNNWPDPRAWANYDQFVDKYGNRK